MTNLVEEALKYASRGWFVVPDHSVTPDGRCTCLDPACKVQGKHPRMERESRDGHFRGTGSRSPDQIRAWWEKWPDSNVAIVCGKGTNLVAIDLDPRNNGFRSWEHLLALHGGIPETLTIKTGGGGRHLLFSHPGSQIVRNRIGLRPGIDIKADAGRIVAPPSRHKSGNVYQWEDFSREPIRLPQWLLQMIQLEKGTGTWQAMKKAKQGAFT